MIEYSELERGKGKIVIIEFEKIKRFKKHPRMVGRLRYCKPYVPISGPSGYYLDFESILLLKNEMNPVELLLKAEKKNNTDKLIKDAKYVGVELSDIRSIEVVE